jgi:hypothetical protein
MGGVGFDVKDLSLVISKMPKVQMRDSIGFMTHTMQ